MVVTVQEKDKPNPPTLFCFAGEGEFGLLGRHVDLPHLGTVANEVGAN
jgi:hypothetical protein